MNIRFVQKTDILGIRQLYANRLSYQMAPELYDHFYLNRQANNSMPYTSLVAEDNGRIVGHNALILNQYLHNGIPLTIGLSSAGMVEEDYSGIFYPLLKKCFQEIYCDVVIAFPNQHSRGFFTRIFGFDVIPQNYFTVTAESFQPLKAFFSKSRWQRTKSHIDWRLRQDQRYNYQKLLIENEEIWFKTYQNQQLDLMYVSRFSNALLKQMAEWLKVFEQINLVHWDEAFCRSIGAMPAKNNVFVYQAMKKNQLLNDFECQMIDSDVF